MTSRKLQALDFIKRYFAQWGQSPTLGEIAAALEVSPKRAHDLVHQLSLDKMIEVLSGKTRGIRLLDPSLELSDADVLLLLTSRGWTIVGERAIEPPEGEPMDLSDAIRRALTEKGLPGVPHLGHDAASEIGVGLNEQIGKQGESPEGTRQAKRG